MPKRLSVELCLDARIPAGRVERLLLGEAFKAVQLSGMSLDPPPTVLLERIDPDASYYAVRFYVDPDAMSPSEAQSRILTAMHAAVACAGLPSPVQQVELSKPLPEFGDSLTAREALGGVSLFAKALNVEQLDMLAARCTLAAYPQGTPLMEQGAVESSMFVILDGAARVTVASNGTVAARQVAVLASGDIVGEMSLMTGAPRSASVTALTPLRALIITKETIEPLFASAPELLERFSAILTERDTELKARMNQSSRGETAQRDLLSRMRVFFARAFSGADKRPI